MLVVRDVLASVAHYRDVLGFRVEFTYGEPVFYAGVERGWQPSLPAGQFPRTQTIL